MTSRRGRVASERKSGIEKDKRQPEMARLATRCEPSNLEILVTLRKKNHPGEAHERYCRRKALYKKERDSLEGPMSKQTREGLRPQRRYMFRKEKSTLENDPEKFVVEIKRRKKLNKKKWGWRLAWWGSNEKKEALHFLGKEEEASTLFSPPVKSEHLV